ncbi:unnamed protein product [Medioppia subpectinata]|uniref:Uncharacterized protein n=1 Tax=Medioppia subpectinata TaxID=1979941 RepID=A0A7R9KCT5_9ACAR|nr:unnamed protein product [Medioppia subpectinata]CAG2101054.1 unnamed protein product [Medioppia subpectinata]
MYFTLIELVGVFAAIKENLILTTVFASLMGISLFFKFHFQAGYVEGVTTFMATICALSLIYQMLKIKD